jgi:hypothetical protein
MSAGAQPANDNFANRTVLIGSAVAVTNSLAGATSEPGEPFITGISSGQTAWWTWTAPSNGIVTISTGGTAFNPLLAVYTGSELTNLGLDWIRWLHRMGLRKSRYSQLGV